MKRALASLALLTLFAAPALSQTNYVEVIVKDTVLTEPKSWFYTVSLTPDYETTMPMSADTMSDPPAISLTKKPKPKRTTIAEVTALAKRNNGLIVNDSIVSDYSVTRRSDYTPESTTVQFTSRDALTRFVKALKAFKDVDGRLSGAVNDEIKNAVQQLDNKLMTMARERAENLAALSNRKLGAVLLVSEDTDNTNSSFKEFLEMIFKYDGAGRKSELYNLRPDKVMSERTLKVRFALL